MFVPLCLGPLHRICPDESVRYALNSVRLERHTDGKAWATVTDGRLMLAVEWDEPVDSGPKVGFAANVPLAVWKAACSMGVGPKHEAGFVLGEEAAEGELALSVRADCGNVRVQFRPIDGRYPDWRHLMAPYLTGKKERQEGVSVPMLLHLQPEVVAKFIDVTSKLNINRVVLAVDAPKADPGKPDAPVYFRSPVEAPNSPVVHGMLMPLT